MKQPPRDQEAFLQLSRSTAMEFAKETIKGCILINGAAAAGIVTFLPNAITAGLGVQSLANAAFIFGVGAVLGVVTFGLSYIAQVYISEVHPATAKQIRIFSLWRYGAVASAIASGLAFLLGIYIAGQALVPIAQP